MATVEDLHIDAAALKKVHDLLKKDVGAVKVLFSTGLKPNTHNIKDITEDTVQQYDLDQSGKAAALYLYSLARVKGTESCEYNAFLGVLRHPCPKAPTDNSSFLPYLAYLCAPTRKKCVRDDRLIDSKQYDPADQGLIMPPHPSEVEKPLPSQRHMYKELEALLNRAGDKISLIGFGQIMKEVDRDTPNAEIRRLFTEGCIAAKVSGKIDDKNTTVPGNVLYTVCRPQLTMEKQKSQSSSLVRGAFSWDIPTPPTPTKDGLGTSRNTPRGGAGGNTPRSSSNRGGAINLPSLSGSLGGSNGGVGGSSSRSSSTSSARKGFQPTKSAALRQQLSKDLINDPTCPYYKGAYKHIPAVPESHYKKQDGMGLTSRYSVRGGNSPRRAADMGGSMNSAEGGN